MTDNPLLANQFQIRFKDIHASHVEPGVKAILGAAQARIETLAQDPAPRTYANTIQALDEITQRVSEALTPIHHLLSVAESPELREAFNAVLPEITQFWSRLPLNEALWHQVKTFSEQAEANALEGLEARHLKKTVREFQRAGAELPQEKKTRLEGIRLELAKLQRKFSENVLDATADYSLLVTETSRLEGIPEGPLSRFSEEARTQGMDGWILSLDHPSFEPVMKYCQDRELRREVYQAYVGRCRGDEFDNVPLIPQILALRQELALTLGYRHFPDYRLEEAMAKSGDNAVAFEEDLVARTRPYWERDLGELRTHAADLGIDELEPWDVAFVAESLRKEKYDIDDELLRPFFPQERVLTGLFELVRRIFGLTVFEAENDQVWDPEVRFYEIRDEGGLWLGSFYTDWLPRKEKRQGAWMNAFRSGGPSEVGGFSPHLGFIAGNFSPPENGKPSLLNHREVQTVFHEFGHLLHHLTSRVRIPDRGGLNVAWDWVELPSQIMENWTLEEEALTLFSGHFETGEPLPSEVLDRMIAARRFLGGWYQMRQLTFGTLDLALHRDLAPLLVDVEDGETDPAGRVLAFVEDRLMDMSPTPTFARNHILTTFSHLFSGGYAAGYYSYLWSEVLDADAFTRFKKEGVLNRDTGRAYVDAILSKGDSAEPEALFREFMGRDPEPEALLERNLGPPPTRDPARRRG
ncbi:MAG: M3 family metallopeptidase [Gemmatimonadetes bacterium]|nr:M3 family metallopeptidase [Gemmatimonadota bacterium]